MLGGSSYHLVRPSISLLQFTCKPVYGVQVFALHRITPLRIALHRITPHCTTPSFVPHGWRPAPPAPCTRSCGAPCPRNQQLLWRPEQKNNNAAVASTPSAATTMPIGEPSERGERKGGETDRHTTYETTPLLVARDCSGSALSFLRHHQMSNMGKR